MRRVKEYQTLIAALTLAVSFAYGTTKVAAAALHLSYRAGEAVSQHHQIIAGQGQMLRMIQDRCK